MLTRISKGLTRLSTGWVTLVALVVFVLFTALVLPAQSAAADPVASVPEAEDVGSPDLSLWYTPSELYRMAEAYGPEGRRAYVRARFTFDVAWPLVYGVFLITAISWLYARGLKPGSSWRLANLTPVLGVILDFLENVSSSLVMFRYPSRTPGIDALAPVFTLVKWVLVGGSFVLLLVGLVAVIWRWVAGRKK